MTVTIYNRHGATVRRSANLRGVLLHYRANPNDMVIKVKRDSPLSAKMSRHCRATPINKNRRIENGPFYS